MVERSKVKKGGGGGRGKVVKWDPQLESQDSNTEESLEGRPKKVKSVVLPPKVPMVSST